MALIIAGIDEAGYGPTLGPLCVGMSAFAMPDPQIPSPTPDLWKLLDAAICRQPGRGGKVDSLGRIAIADSKELKLSNSIRSAHPLVHLERGVLSFMRLLSTNNENSLADSVPLTDIELIDHLSLPVTTTAHHQQPSQSSPVLSHLHRCYDGAPTALPLGESRGELLIKSAALVRACTHANIKLVELRTIIVPESDFNAIIRETSNKGETTTYTLGKHLRLLWDRYAIEGENRVGVACDRLGGRTSYSILLERELHGSRVQTLDESPDKSRYIITGTGADGRPRRLGVSFSTGGEQAHLPIALASMSAKLCRELLMLRFNTYWNSLYRELNACDIAPTAGYATDARRWLSQVGTDVFVTQDRNELTRIA